MPMDLSQTVTVPADGEPVGRAVINGAVVIYNHEDPPVWLRPILRARDENGDVDVAMYVHPPPDTHGTILVEYYTGAAQRAAL